MKKWIIIWELCRYFHLSLISLIFAAAKIERIKNTKKKKNETCIRKISKSRRKAISRATKWNEIKFKWVSVCSQLCLTFERGDAQAWIDYCDGTYGNIYAVYSHISCVQMDWMARADQPSASDTISHVGISFILFHFSIECYTTEKIKFLFNPIAEIPNNIYEITHRVLWTV